MGALKSTQTDSERRLMKIVCLSDTHGDHAAVSLPAGDVLVHAGDMTAHGTLDEFADFLAWFSAQAFAHHLIVAGNHDTSLEANAAEAQALCERAGVVWLNDSGITLDGLSFWGSPITPRFHDWSFMRDPGEDIQKHWRMIPEQTDVLITHGPPLGILDQIEREDGSCENTGCPSLLETVQALQPQLHIFGHIHEGRGEHLRAGTRFLNVSSMNKFYQIQHPPVVVELEAA